MKKQRGETDKELKARIQRVQHRHQFDGTGQDEENELEGC